MTVKDILRQFERRSALVVGDICLDRWCTYDPSAAQPSRETGIPRIGVVSTETTAGAGGTVANNLAALGVGRVAVLGVTGSDGFGMELMRALDERRIERNLVIAVAAAQTFTYTKLINLETGLEDLARVDFINVRPLDQAVEQRLIERLRAAVPDFDVILVSDQAETIDGMAVTPPVRETLAKLSESYPEKVFWVDSRERLERFRRVFLKANEAEVEAACGRLCGSVDLQRLRREVEARALLVTHGPAGVLIADGRGERWVRTRPVEKPVDICGAGDSFSAGAAMALSVTGSVEEAARFGNIVASLTIMKRGTGTASPEEIIGLAGANEGKEQQ